jgi:hypothetical protein
LAPLRKKRLARSRVRGKMHRGLGHPTLGRDCRSDTTAAVMRLSQDNAFGCSASARPTGGLMA